MSKIWFFSNREDFLNGNLSTIYPHAALNLDYHFDVVMDKECLDAITFDSLLKNIDSSKYVISIRKDTISNMKDDEWFFTFSTSDKELATLFRLIFC